MSRTWVVVGLISACYRDPAPMFVPVAGRPILAASCSPEDDLAHPPFDNNPNGRLRTQTTGVLSGANQRRWAGASLPPYVDKAIGTLELFLLDEADGGHLAFYREPYNVGACTLGDAMNCAYEARFYDASGRVAWSLRLDALLSRPDQLEIQDIRLAGGVLYFNEACQSYSSGANGQCSALVAVEPRQRRILWRTRNLVSNGRFRITGCNIVAGYGFTAEPDYVFLVDRTTGRVLSRRWVSKAPQEMTLVAGDRIDVRLYSGALRRYQIARGQLVSLDPPEVGGAGYGGAAYGGDGY
jgi:hypothetical protein